MDSVDQLQILHETVKLWVILDRIEKQTDIPEVRFWRFCRFCRCQTEFAVNCGCCVHEQIKMLFEVSTRVDTKSIALDGVTVSPVVTVPGSLQVMAQGETTFLRLLRDGAMTHSFSVQMPTVMPLLRFAVLME